MPNYARPSSRDGQSAIHGPLSVPLRARHGRLRSNGLATRRTNVTDATLCGKSGLMIESARSPQRLPMARETVRGAERV